MSEARGPRLAVVGVGNPLAGDDGVGVRVVERLRALAPPGPDVFWGTLEGDLLAVADWLPCASHFIFVDAVAGGVPGTIVVGPSEGRAWAPSFHQTDLASTLRVLEAMGAASPFPTWEIWGITITPPEELGEGLSPAVAAAADQMVERLLAELSSRREASSAARATG
ncbi:MAG: hydrogenase maturation protease [Thermoanaerobaculaceae bacterium]|nr:hydrogenase maturation protease [Thermoanaerobaculaceae bacterium]